MAIATNTSLTYSSVELKKQIADIIYNIAPLDTPFFSGCSRSDTVNTLFQWQTDTIGSGAANRQIEGDDSPSASARSLPTLLNNRTQISRYVVQTSGTDQAVGYVGHGKHQAYMIAKRGKQMKRDWEKMLSQNIAKVTGDSTTARVSAGLPTWLGTNWVSMNPGSGSPAASSGDGSDTMTEATATASITEAGIKNVILDAYNAGGNPDMILCPATIKQAISGLSSNAGPGYAIRNEIRGDGAVTAINAVDIYVSDFGSFKIVPDRNLYSTEHVFFLDMDYWGLNVLRDWTVVDLAKTGDSVKQMLLYEAGLCSKNEKSSGILADCKA
tara:strand:+ start:416 stop:1396 length:981 start_codon:yes stop_codon:yes gene_type:complete